LEGACEILYFLRVIAESPTSSVDWSGKRTAARARRNLTTTRHRFSANVRKSLEPKRATTKSSSLLHFYNLSFLPPNDHPAPITPNHASIELHQLHYNTFTTFAHNFQPLPKCLPKPQQRRSPPPRHLPPRPPPRRRRLARRPPQLVTRRSEPRPARRPTLHTSTKV
jgi:hypothetical protein